MGMQGPRQHVAKCSNWTGKPLPAKRPGTLTKVYFGMIKQSAQEALRKRQILRRQSTRHGTGWNNSDGNNDSDDA